MFWGQFPPPPPFPGNALELLCLFILPHLHSCCYSIFQRNPVKPNQLQVEQGVVSPTSCQSAWLKNQQAKLPQLKPTSFQMLPFLLPAPKKLHCGLRLHISNLGWSWLLQQTCPRLSPRGQRKRTPWEILHWRGAEGHRTLIHSTEKVKKTNKQNYSGVLRDCPSIANEKAHRTAHN